MSIVYCHACDKHIDMDWEAEHFEKPEEGQEENLECYKSLNT